MCWLTSCARLFTAFQYVDAFLLIHDRIYAEAFDTFGISKFLLKCFQSLPLNGISFFFYFLPHLHFHYSFLNATVIMLLHGRERPEAEGEGPAGSALRLALCWGMSR